MAELTVKLDMKDTVKNVAIDLIEAAFRAGHAAGNSLAGTIDGDEEWAEYRASILVETDTVEVTEGSGNVFADLNVTLTLDDVSNRINAICEAHLERCKAAQVVYMADCEALGKAVDASPDLDEAATIAIVMGRVKKLMAEIGAIGK